MPVKVRLLSKFSRFGASSRLRMLQYVPHLSHLGVTVDHRPLLSDMYVRALFAGSRYRSRTLAMVGYANRIAELQTSAAYDLDWIEGELLPFVPRIIEKVLAWRRRPFVVEYDDALFHRYGLSASAVVRTALGRKIGAVMREATYVIAGNDYLAEYARRAGAERIAIVPTVVDAARYVPRAHCNRGRLVIGWIGSPVTQHYLYELRDVLREICARHGAVVMLVGASPDAAKHLVGVPLDCVAWSEHNEPDLVAAMDVGIMPLLDGPWERGKCGYKLVQYMACGLPVVASPVGVNPDLVESGVTGFLPSDLGEWVNALSSLLGDAATRTRMGEAGRLRVERELCVDVQAPRLASIMHEVAGR
ncbi:MAG: glycosyltransferase [Rhodanobacter sp.]|nr:MAG: glycosyltransferase [Rhodanobacter sp.]TAM08737.1 MAG: glycosyltransferase [Rhodanobacter sp.]TAM36779.1 MAG: glycosyltransferase [Rhodanobacter sp.]